VAVANGSSVSSWKCSQDTSNWSAAESALMNALGALKALRRGRDEVAL
jgi:hypothetical protein